MRDVFGSADAVAAALEAFCRDTLGAGVAQAEFFDASVGSVHGLTLEDGRRVVVKAHAPGASVRFLRAMQEVQRHLATGGYPCPEPLVPPTVLGAGVAVAETLIDRGTAPNGHDPAVRRALAAGLCDIVQRCRPLVALEGLDEHAMTVPPGALWPTPHDRRFDFEGTSSGAEWIDRLAAEACRIRDAASAELVVAHSDWRVQHVRMLDEKLTAVYDWDSIMLMTEPQAVGSGAHAFTMNWETGDLVSPSLEEMRAFVAEYEEARGRDFSPVERRAAFGSLVYSLAYTARCQHSDALTDFGQQPAQPGRAVPSGGAHAMLATHGDELLRG
ncbi:MAG: hypothetical protein QOH73_34 [Gaiellaceae bacterium]|nr:hypothetical protein [Gaiellaceae bacterium]